MGASVVLAQSTSNKTSDDVSDSSSVKNPSHGGEVGAGAGRRAGITTATEGIGAGKGEGKGDGDGDPEAKDGDDELTISGGIFVRFPTKIISFYAPTTNLSQKCA